MSEDSRAAVLTPPGEALAAALAALGLSQAEACRRTGYSTKHLNRIIKHSDHISVDVAANLQLDLGVDALALLDAQTRWELHRALNAPEAQP